MSLMVSLFKNCNGFVEIRVPRKNGGKNETIFAKPNDGKKIGDFVKKHINHENIYFGVATRDKNGTKDGIQEIPAAWVDIDFKDVPQYIVDPIIEDFKNTLPPSIIIHTGNGYHLYWIFEESLSKEYIEIHEQINMNLAGHLCGDFSGIDSSRILRVPNTYNQKYADKPKVTVLENNSHRYLLEDFKDLTHFDKPSKNGKSKTGNNKDSERINRIMKCEFMKHCEENAENLDEPSWYAMLTQLCQETGGRSKIHELSEPYKNYSQKETDQKILHATDKAPGPYTCEYIKSNLHDCGQRCEVTAPKHLAFQKADITGDTKKDEGDQRGDQDETPNGGEKRQNKQKGDQRGDQRGDQMGDHSKDRANMTLTDEIKEFINSNTGIFTTQHLDRELGVKTKVERNNRTKALNKLVKKGLIEKVGGQAGKYEIPSMELRRQVPEDFSPDGVNLPWPLGIGDVATIDPGSSVVVAGVHNAGKTSLAFSLLFNILVQSEEEERKSKKEKRENSTSTIREAMGVDDLRIVYLNTEMQDVELNRKLRSYDEPDGQNRLRKAIENRTVDFYKPEMKGGKYSNFIDPDGINILDFLEVYKDFYAIGQAITDIHNTLNNGIAIILTQKSQDKGVGRGGDFSAEKPRLYITLDNNYPHCKTATIVKAKIPTDDEKDPNGLSKDFIITEKGTNFKPLTDWEHIHKNRRKELNEGYAAEKETPEDFCA